MASEKQREANRKNAQRSTGPNTEAGKDIARYNALKHGMRSSNLEVLPNEDLVAYQARVDAWIDEYQPTSASEDNLVRHAANLSWKRDRIERYETTILSIRVGDAMTRAKQARLERFQHAGRQLLPRENEVVREGFDRADALQLRTDVETTVDGCRRLLAAWRELREVAVNRHGWNAEQEMHVVRLMGQGPRTIADPETIDVVMANRIALYPNFPDIPEKWYDGTLRTYFDKPAIRAAFARKPSDAESAFARMVAAADGAIARLEEKLTDRERAHEQAEDEEADFGSMEADLAGVLVSFDPSNEGERLRRYQFSLNRELVRTLETLAKMRREEAKRRKAEEKKSICANEANSEDVRQECRNNKSVSAPNEANSEHQSPRPPSSCGPDTPVRRSEGGQGADIPRSTNQPAPNEANWSDRKKRSSSEKLMAAYRRAKR